MNDEGMNDWLRETYGTTIDGSSLFRVSWTTDLRETRKGTFCDFYGDVIIREVTEVRNCLKYPFAQNRWVVEVIGPTPKEIYGAELFQKYTYEEVYILQDGDKFIPLNRDIVVRAIALYFKLKQIPMKDRIEMRVKMMADREKRINQRNRDMIGDALRSPMMMPWVY